MFGFSHIYKWLTNWLTYKLTERTIVFWELTNPKLVKKFPAIYVAWWFITLFTRVNYLSQINPIHVILLFPEDLFNIFLLSTPGFSKCLLYLRFPHKKKKNLYASLLPRIRATCPSYLILLYLITRVIFGEEYRSQSSSLCSLLHSLLPRPS